MRLRRYIALVLSVAVLLAAAGCGDRQPVPAGEQGEPLATVNPNNEKRFAYAITYAEDSSQEVKELAKEMRKTLRGTFSSSVTLTTASKSSGGMEILIGQTGQRETQEAAQRLKDNRQLYYLDFIIKVIGDKIVLYSENDSMLQKAVSYFTETYCTGADAWNQLTTLTEIIYEAPLEAKPHELAGTPLEQFTIVTPRDMEYIYGRAVTELVEYLNQDQGYTLPVQDQRNEPVEHEILIGDLEREESRAVSVSGENAWILRLANGKLVIKAGSSLALWAGIHAFTEEIRRQAAAGAHLSLTDGYELTGVYEPADNEYAYVWGDEFNGNTLDRSKWGDYYNDPIGNTTPSLLGGQFIQKGYENVKLTGDGMATVFTERNGKDFTGGYLCSDDHMQYRYGIMEMRVQLGVKPAHFALWMNGGNIPRGAAAEFDLLENFGETDSFASNIHLWSEGMYHLSLDGGEYQEAKQYHFSDSLAPEEDLSNSFHVYTLAWDDRKVDFAFDGKVFFSYSLDDHENVDYCRLSTLLLITASMGGTGWASEYEEGDPEYSELKVDYVRLYQRADIGLFYTADQIAAMERPAED